MTITVETTFSRPESPKTVKSEASAKAIDKKETLVTEPDNFLSVRNATQQSQTKLKPSLSNDSLQVKSNDNFVKFDIQKDEFKFGTIGIYNTERGKYLYRVLAKIANHLYTF